MKSQREISKESLKRHTTPIRPVVWSKFSDEQLLNMRFCDLGITVENSPMSNCMIDLYEELETKKISFRPHCWFSEEWFSPDGVPGIAIPFYLSHARLRRLERKLMMEVEGGTHEECMKILRHEAGHALDTAYQLSRRARWRVIFGKSSMRYPRSYCPLPGSKAFVLHLKRWYAQSHPSEDFAETFAVWLNEPERCQEQYEDWGARTKLEYVAQVMGQVSQRPVICDVRSEVEPLEGNTRSLRSYYREKRRRYAVGKPSFCERDLLRIFTCSTTSSNRMPACHVLEGCRRQLQSVDASWSVQYRYLVEQMLEEMTCRCRELDLCVDRPVNQVKREVLCLLVVNAMTFLQGKYHRLTL